MNKRSTVIGLMIMAALMMAFLVVGCGQDVKSPVSTNEPGGLLAPPELPDVEEFAPDHILVKFKPDANIAEINVVLGVKILDVIPEINVHVIGIPEVARAEGMVNQFSQNPNVDYAELDYIAHADFTPNDPYFAKQWGLHNTGQTGGKSDADIDAPEAWNKTKGKSSIKITICDTGIDQDHEDLKGKITANKNFTKSPTVDDKYGHGTHVAGIAAAITHNSKGVAGTGYNSALMNAKVLDDTGSGSYSWVANGIIWAADNGAKVINLSLGGSSSSKTLEDAVNYAWKKGVVLAAAADNKGSSAKSYPAAYTNCIAVAATDHKDLKPSWSNYGASWVDVAAPGNNIYSTFPNHGSPLGKNYGALNGTSMATPFVSGTAALVWTTSYGTSNSTVRKRIESTADKIPDTGTYWKYGRINAYNAVK